MLISEMNERWRIELFGGLRAQQNHREITRFRTQKTGALLAYLAYYLGKPHPREVLIDLLWPEGGVESGRNRLRVALTSLRHQLEPPGVPPNSILIANRSLIQLNPAAVTTDAADFEGLLQSAAATGSSAEQTQLFMNAAQLYRGPLLSGFYEDWIIPEQNRLADSFFRALHQLVESLARAGEVQRAFEYARHALSFDPLREEPHRDLMRLYVAVGQLQTALRQYHELEEALEQQAGGAPSRRTHELAREIEKRLADGIAQGRPPEPDRSKEHKGQQTKDKEGRDKERRGKETTPSPAALPAAPAAAARDLNVAPPVAAPMGTVTFLLADVTIPTALRGAEPIDATLEEYHTLLQQQFRSHQGYRIKLTPHSFRIAFARASDALACAIACQQTLGAHPEMARPTLDEKASAPKDELLGSLLQARMALDTNDVPPHEPSSGGAVAKEAYNTALQRATQVLLAAHEGQILCSETTAALLKPALGAGSTSRALPIPVDSVAHASALDLRLTDLGLYLLHEIPAPQRLFQVEYPGMERREFPAPRAAPVHTGNLPLQFTRFFGRAAEVAQLVEMLAPEPGGASGNCRLVTLTGSGGSGKTRLAMEVGRRLLEPFRGEVWFVPLADLTDPQLIINAVHGALRLSPAPDVEPVEQVIAALAQQPALLLLDNFEHLMAAGVPLLQTLLERIPHLSCLVTSRQRLNLMDEREFTVQPLPSPHESQTPEQLVLNASVQLFVDRAQAVRSDFQVTEANAPAIAQICKHLDGIPLALELAAARARVLSPPQILDHLEQRLDFLVSPQRDRAPRHRTLRAAIEWSYHLLTPELQEFFIQLAVFRGGWALEAAEAVCGNLPGSPASQPSPGVVLDYLEQLRDFSLVVIEETLPEQKIVLSETADAMLPLRFRMLETLRQFAREKLQESAALDIQTQYRHGAYFLEFARQRIRKLRTSDELIAFQELEADLDNMRAALDCSLQFADHTDLHEAVIPVPGFRILCAQLALAVGVFLERRGLHKEAIQRIEKGLDALGLEASGQESRQLESQRTDRHEAVSALQGYSALHAELLRERAGLHIDQGEWSAARQCAEASLALFKGLHDLKGEAEACNLLGLAALSEKDFSGARAHFKSALTDFEQAHDEMGIATVHNNLGIVEKEDQHGSLSRARHHWSEALRLRQKYQDKRGMAEALNNLGVTAQEQGALAEAWRYYDEALHLEQDLHHAFGVARALSNLGELLDLQNDEKRALRLFTAAKHLFGDIGSPHSEYVSNLMRNVISKLDYSGAAEETSQRLPQHQSLDALISWALTEGKAGS